MSLTSQETAKILKEHQLSANDTGSPEAQVALLTARIKGLTEHFKTHNHDYHSRRGLIRLVSLRRKLLTYLKNKDLQRYQTLVEKLNLRVSQ